MAEQNGYEKVENLQWKPAQDGDEIEGVLAKKTKLGVKQNNAYFIETSKGRYLVWGSAVLDDRLAMINEGDTVKICYHGKKPNAKGQPTHQFEVYRLLRKI